MNVNGATALHARKWNRRSLLFVAVFALLIAAAFLLFRPRQVREFQYGGRTVTEWSHALSGPAVLDRLAAEQAFRAMGTNAVSDLTRALIRREPIYRKPALSLINALPARMRMRFHRALRLNQINEDRAMAAYAFQFLGRTAEQALPVLARSLGDSERRVSFYAAQAMGSMGAAAAAPLAERLKRGNGPERLMALHGLTLLGLDAAPAVPALVRTLNSSSAEEARLASAVLARIGPASVPALIDCLREGSPASQLAATALSGIGPLARDAIPVLLDQARSADETVRITALRTLTNIRPTDARVRNAFVAALNDSDARFRSLALEGLARGARKAGPALDAILSLWERDPEPGVRRAAAIAAGRIGAIANPETAGILGKFVAGLNGSSTEAKVDAALGLAALQDQAASAVPALLDNTAHSNAEVRAAVALALREAKVSSPEVMAALQSLLSDPVPSVAQQARDALTGLRTVAWRAPHQP
jgi:HEAT repeat protein